MRATLQSVNVCVCLCCGSSQCLTSLGWLAAQPRPPTQHRHRTHTHTHTPPPLQLTTLLPYLIWLGDVQSASSFASASTVCLPIVVSPGPRTLHSAAQSTPSRVPCRAVIISCLCLNINLSIIMMRCVLVLVLVLVMGRLTPDQCQDNERIEARQLPISIAPTRLVEGDLKVRQKQIPQLPATDSDIGDQTGGILCASNRIAHFINFRITDASNRLLGTFTRVALRMR